MSVSSPVIDVFINSVVEGRRNKEGSRCLQLQTRLWGGVDWLGEGEAGRVWSSERGYRGVTAGPCGGSGGRLGSYDLKKPFSL